MESAPSLNTPKANWMKPYLAANVLWLVPLTLDVPVSIGHMDGVGIGVVHGHW